MMAKLCDMLIYLRKREGLSQQELADKLEMTRSAISMYETGKREPDLETLETFADFYNVDMDTLTGRNPARWQTAQEMILPFVANALRIPQEALAFEDGVLKVADGFEKLLDPNWVSLLSNMRYLVELNFPALPRHTAQEFTLLTLFKSLNKEGRRKLLERAEELAEHPKYQIDDVIPETSPESE